MQDTFQLAYWKEQVALFNDQGAYEQLFLYYNDRLYHLAYSFVRSEETAEEIVSDVFVNLWRNRARLLEIESLDVYLYVSIKNLSLKHLSRLSSGTTFSMDDLLLDQVEASALSPEELMVSKEVLREIHAAIDSLPPKCKLIFKLVREDGLKYKEIAQILNISVKTIDAQMAIAARKIAQSLRFILPQ